jgi:mono/diheme cytochrome c family protein
MSGAVAAILSALAFLGQGIPDPPEVAQRGAYLARAGDCGACHTAQGGSPFAGGRPIATPIGKIISTNITPDPETGIGRYTANDFVKAMRLGVARDGHHLYPAMPYTSYGRVAMEDLMDLYAYFMQGVEPVAHPNQPTALPWPLSVRSLMAVWNALYLKKGVYRSDPGSSPSWNRGAYLVQGLGHCGGCHTPRGLAGQEKAAENERGRRFLSGATQDGWHAPPLRGDSNTGLQAWSREEIADFLETGRTERVAALGVMAGVVAKSTQYLTAEDRMAIAEYLKSLPPGASEGSASAEEPVRRQPDGSAATQALRAGATGIRGAALYLDNCNACHRSDGSGAKRAFPDLRENEAVNAENPTSLIHIILDGTTMPSTVAAPTAFAMPALGWRLNDREVADVLSFIRSSWGNRASGVSDRQVRRIRKFILKGHKAK